MGFTLIEVLVVLAIVSLMSLMAWRGLDTMIGQQQRLQTRAERVQTLQTALAQWHADWSQLHASPELQAWDWDGQVLRLTRRTPAGTDAETTRVSPNWAWMASIRTSAKPCSAAAYQSWRKGSGGISPAERPGSRFWALPDTSCSTTAPLSPWLTKAD